MHPFKAISGKGAPGKLRVMAGTTLRAKFMLAMVMVTAGLTIGALFIVRDRVSRHIQLQVRRDLESSSDYLKTFERRRTELTERMAVFVADTPLLKALMTTRDPATVQDGTEAISRIAGAQLFVVSEPGGRIMAMHGLPGSARPSLQTSLESSLQAGRHRDWWLVNGRLYDVILTAVSSGAGTDSVEVGTLACGFEVDPSFAKQVATLADGEVIISYRDTPIVSTMAADVVLNLDLARTRNGGIHDVQLQGERFLVADVPLAEGGGSGPVLVLLKSYDKATSFLSDLNWVVISIGLLAIVSGVALAFFISHRFTSPLRELLTGVQALETGQYDYPLHPAGHDEAAQLTHAFAHMRDALHKSQEQLLRSARMEALGRLAGGVAHDFNNIITIISGYGELALDRSTNDPQLTSYVHEIRKAGERATGLTRQLLAFSRKQALQPQPLDLNSILGNINKMLRVLVGEDVQLVFSQAAKLPTVMADPGQIEQVIMNLAANARDAMPGGGALTLSTSLATADTLNVPAGEQSVESYVVLAVTDTGTGMSPDTVKNIFEPFYTTKAPGKGTGLGLATVYGIVRQSGGFLDVQSELGQGTTFRVCLPAVQREARQLHDCHVVVPRKLASGVILVVEDEEPVRRLAVAGLQESGYEVVAAANGREALELLARRDRVDLVVTDVIMPQMGGRELFDELRRHYPATNVLFMSGYTDRSLEELGLELETSLLQKPFTPHSLAAKVAEVLGNKSTAGYGDGARSLSVHS